MWEGPQRSQSRGSKGRSVWGGATAPAPARLLGQECAPEGGRREPQLPEGPPEPGAQTCWATLPCGACVTEGTRSSLQATVGTAGLSRGSQGD